MYEAVILKLSVFFWYSNSFFANFLRFGFLSDFYALDYFILRALSSFHSQMSAVERKWRLFSTKRQAKSAPRLIFFSDNNLLVTYNILE